MRLRGWLRQRRATVAGNLALALAAGVVAAYAVNAEGYQAHEADLNDGGIWVTSATDGSFGRINKPIGQLDAKLFAQYDDQLDVAQDGDEVLGINRSQGWIKPVDPATVTHPEGEEASVPGGADVALAGDTVAVVDPVTGKVWGQRVDPELGLTNLSVLDTTSKPLVTVGGEAALTVTEAGSVVALSADEDTVTTVPAVAMDFGGETKQPLGVDVGPGSSVTSVGERAVVLDPAGTLQVVGGPTVDVPEGSVLQQAGPEADPDSDDVLVGAPDGLWSVDLDSGEATELVGDVAGRPAEPVRLGACSYGAWSGGDGLVATACAGSDPVPQQLGGAAADLVFRVNRDEIVLNDRSSGAVWNIDSTDPTRIDNWDSFRFDETPDDEAPENQQENQGDVQPPKAKDDRYGARPGRTAILHPLDNDTAPGGRLLAVTSIRDVSGPGQVEVSPDGQTISIRLDEDATKPTSFEYFIDDGRDGKSAHANVTVSARRSGNARPALRHGYDGTRQWIVPASGSLDLPVLSDWRDDQDGDPVTLVSAAVVGAQGSGAEARATSTGQVRFTAPREGGVYKVQYVVTDGMGADQTQDVQFKVQSRDDRTAVAATARPDIATGEAGKAVTITPLGNDLPGADPVTPDAEVSIAGRVAEPAGTTVQTDLVDGKLTFTASRPDTYFLAYEAAYGNAPLSTGKIRVDIKAPESQEPVAMPDTLTLHGQAPSLVDVLANDVDPAGDLLVVMRAEAEEDNQLDVAVVDGRWLQVSARQGVLTPNPQLVHYTISNGHSADVEGEVLVSQVATPDDNAPVTEPDRVTVRAGGAVSVAPLDNDFSPDGGALSLLNHVSDQGSGELRVGLTSDDEVPTGQAFVAGRLVRYVAPTQLKETQDFEVTYVATNADGDRSPGVIEITVVPEGARNQAPEPPVLEGRVVSGEKVKLKLPGAGVDPNGDGVSVLGIASAPALGRVVSYGANVIEYEAYPGSSGTDTFTYVLTDTLGATAIASVRVGVVKAGTPQPPLAVPDSVTVEPGRTARVDVVANDLVAAGDRVSLELVNPPAGVHLETPTGPVVIPAPETVDGEAVDVVYRISNGIDSSQAAATLRTATPYNNPPVVFDAFGSTTRGETVDVDVLATALDPDGPSADLRIAEVLPPEGVRASVHGPRITVTREPTPTVVPFRVVDADGGAATASLFVPAAGAGPPYVKPGAQVRVSPDGRAEVNLSDVVVNPTGGPLSLTEKDRIWSSPNPGLSAAVVDGDTFEVLAAKGYRGPAAVSVEVSTGSGPDDRSGKRTVVSIPVLVGADAPVLTCPSDPVEVPQSESVDLDIEALCQVWTPDDTMPTFSADWATDVPGLSIVQPTGAVLTVAASGSAKAGQVARLKVTAPGAVPAELELKVTRSQPPSLSAISVTDLRAGSSRTLDLASYLTPGVVDPVPTVVRVDKLTSLDVDVAKAGGSKVTVTTGATASGTARFTVVMSDVAAGGPERQVRGRISVTVLGRPDAPAAPVPGRQVRSQQVHLNWRAPEANGGPIDYYQVRTDGGAVQRCGTTSCDITGLTNGKPYRFSVRAHNAIGFGDWGPYSQAVKPDAPPGKVGSIRQVSVDDGQIRIAWTKPTTKTSPIRKYEVRWKGGKTTVTGTSATIHRLDNNTIYTFTVTARNDYDWGESRTSGSMQPVGTPSTPLTPRVDQNETADGKASITFKWGASDPNGPKPVTYSVLRNGSPLRNCSKITAVSCVDSGIEYDGKKYTWTVAATNAGGKTSLRTSASWVAVAKPAAWGNVRVWATSQSNEGKAEFTVPDSKGADSLVQLYVAGRAQGGPRTMRGRQTITVNTSDNNSPKSVVLKVCNEGGLCSSSDGVGLQTYGPIATSHIVNLSSHVSGTSVSWSATLDGNGADTEWKFASCYASGVCFDDQWTRSSAVDRFSVSRPAKDIGHDANETVRIYLRRAGSNSSGVYVQRTSGRTAPPTVHVQRGSLCSDAAQSDRPKCGGGGLLGGEDCAESSCGRVQITSEGFSVNNTTCRFYRNYGTQFDSQWTKMNETDEPGPWGKASFGTVWVSCQDGSGKWRRSNAYDWPDQ